MSNHLYKSAEEKADAILNSRILSANVGKRLVPPLCQLQEMRDLYEADLPKWQKRYDTPERANQVLEDFDKAISAIRRLIRAGFYADTNIL